jgi:hypothetical protein
MLVIGAGTLGSGAAGGGATIAGGATTWGASAGVFGLKAPVVRCAPSAARLSKSRIADGGTLGFWGAAGVVGSGGLSGPEMARSTDGAVSAPTGTCARQLQQVNVVPPLGMRAVSI